MLFVLLSLELGDVPVIFFCPADHVPDWQPRILLGMIEARSVYVKKTFFFKQRLAVVSASFYIITVISTRRVQSFLSNNSRSNFDVQLVTRGNIQ